MNAVKLLVITFLVSLNSFAATDPRCTYNEWSGELVLAYEAHEPKKARGWAPTALRLCKDDKGHYAIVTHAAIGLGQLSNLPMRVTTNVDDLKVEKTLEELSKGGYYSMLINASSSFNEREAFDLFQYKSLEAALVFTGTKAQILVIRKELSQVVSNTLFLTYDATEKKND